MKCKFKLNANLSSLLLRNIFHSFFIFRMHTEELKMLHSGISDEQLSKMHSETFSSWLTKKVSSILFGLY